jgi:hypothetical protein
MNADQHGSKLDQRMHNKILECLLSCLSTTRRGQRSTSPPRRRAILRRATRTAKWFDTVFAKPGPPTGAVFACWGGKPKDRLCCTAGLAKAAWMLGCPEEQRGRSFASRPKHGAGVEHRVLGSGWPFMGIEVGDSGCSNLGNALSAPIRENPRKSFFFTRATQAQPP